jgi:hypothetical protein
MGETVRARSGKRVLGLVVIVAITVGAGLGLIIGTSPQIQHISFYDTVLFHPTPLSMALYGAIGATVLIGVILGITLVLSQFDGAKV